MLDGLEKSNTQIEKVLNRLHSPLPAMIKRNTQLASGEDIASVKLCDRDYRNLQLKRVTGDAYKQSKMVFWFGLFVVVVVVVVVVF